MTKTLEEKQAAFDALIDPIVEEKLALYDKLYPEITSSDNSSARSKLKYIILVSVLDGFNVGLNRGAAL